MTIRRCKKFPNYLAKRHGDGVTIFRDGSSEPLRPVRGCVREVKFVLWQNGRRYIVSLFEFMKECLNENMIIKS